MEEELLESEIKILIEEDNKITSENLISKIRLNNIRINKAQVIILTGFFGSGKTTLIKNIANCKMASKLAIIQNEFSDQMGIESELIKDGSGNTIGNLFEMPSGCMCCVVRDNTVLFLQKLVKEKLNIEYIIIECHGMAEISKIIKSFWIDDELEFEIKLGKVCCIVDSLNFHKNIEEHNEIFLHQIICSETVILNKISDSLIKHKENSNYLKEIKDKILEINPILDIYETNYCQISLEELFMNNNSYKMSCSLKDNILEFENKKLEDKGNENNNENEFSNCDSHYTNINHIESIFLSFILIGKLDEIITVLDKNIGYLLWEENSVFSIIRIKGIISANNIIYYEIQGIHDTYELKHVNNNFSDYSFEKFTIKLILIGKNVKRNKILIEEKMTFNLNYTQT